MKVHQRRWILAVISMLCLQASADTLEGQWIARRLHRSAGWSVLLSELGSGFQVVKTLGPNGRYALLTGPTDAIPVSNRDFQIQRNFVYRAFDAADPDFEKSWGLQNTGQSITSVGSGDAGKDVGASKAWAIHTGGDTVVAVIDSGIDTKHEDLHQNIWSNPSEIAGNGIDDDGNGYIDDIHGWNFVDGNSNPMDDNGHGTFCSGVIGAQANNQKGTRGVNWKVKLMALKSLDSGGGGSTASAIESITYAVKNGAKVINASWGGAGFDQALYDVVKWAGENDVLFVAAAGNNGLNNDTHPNPMYPASFRLDTMVTVAAYDNRDRIAGFSNFGKATTHIGAPGVQIYSSIPGGYKFGDGTSFAAPFVSGAAALLKSFDSKLNMMEVRERILATSEVISYYEKERISTGGRVHLYNALRNIRPPRPEAPSVWQGFTTQKATAHPYADNENQTFEIVHPGATHIRIRFKGFHTEACCDRVVLQDRQGREVAVHAGQLGDFWSADALGDTMRVTFTSDFSIGEYGFEIDAYDVSYDSTLWAILEELQIPLRGMTPDSRPSHQSASVGFTPHL